MKNKNKIHRYQVYILSDFKCTYCNLEFEIPLDWDKKSALHNGEMFLEIDHIKPLSKGGSDRIENKQALCWRCNNIKSDSYEVH